MTVEFCISGEVSTSSEVHCSTLILNKQEYAPVWVANEI